MKWVVILLVLMSLPACGYNILDSTGNVADSPNAETDVAVPLIDLGPAPELENEVWLNTDQPLRLADLRGKVVLLDMWTFG